MLFSCIGSIKAAKRILPAKKLNSYSIYRIRIYVHVHVHPYIHYIVWNVYRVTGIVSTFIHFSKRIIFTGMYNIFHRLHHDWSSCCYRCILNSVIFHSSATVRTKYVFADFAFDDFFSDVDTNRFKLYYFAFHLIYGVCCSEWTASANLMNVFMNTIRYYSFSIF